MKNRFWICAVVLLATTNLMPAAEPTAPKPAAGATTKPAKTQAELDTWFAATMSHATLNGSYNVKHSDKPPKADKYTLGDVKKTGDDWIFSATIQFGGRDISVPIQLPVKWAGDTAVITVDNLGIPGLGTYTARVMIFGDEYVGIWGSSDGSHGGQMWGRIEHDKK